MPQLLIAITVLLAVTNGTAPALRGGAGSNIAAPPAQKPAPKPPKATAQALICALRTPEAPRGGRLELEGQNFGGSPVVRIDGKVITRIIERTATKIAVQIPADSDGGPVTLSSGTQEANCGTLEIIGKN
jgi:hypothetical protein